MSFFIIFFYVLGKSHSWPACHGFSMLQSYECSLSSGTLRRGLVPLVAVKSVRSFESCEKPECVSRFSRELGWNFCIRSRISVAVSREATITATHLQFLGIRPLQFRARSRRAAGRFEESARPCTAPARGAEARRWCPDAEQGPGPLASPIQRLCAWADSDRRAERSEGKIQMGTVVEGWNIDKSIKKDHFGKKCKTTSYGKKSI